MTGDNNSLNTIQKHANRFATYLQAAIDWHTNTTNLMPVTSAASSEAWQEASSGPLYVRANCGTDEYVAEWDMPPSMPFPGIYCNWGAAGAPNHYSWSCQSAEKLTFFFDGQGDSSPATLLNAHLFLGYSSMPPEQFCGDLQTSDCLLLLQVTAGDANATMPGLCADVPGCARFSYSNATLPLVPPDSYTAATPSNGAAQAYASTFGPIASADSMLGDPAYTKCFNCYRAAAVRGVLSAPAGRKHTCAHTCCTHRSRQY